MNISPCSHASKHIQRLIRTQCRQRLHTSQRLLAQDYDSDKTQKATSQEVEHAKTKEKHSKKTMQQLDEEMRAAMEGHAGDGGMSGVELEGGKAVSMKRGVRDNMFRYI